MAVKLKQIRPEDFDMQVLMTAASEGRLYMAERGQTTNKADTINEVRAYIQRIRGFVTPPFKDSVDDIWERIFADDDFLELLKPGNKTRKCKTFDKYSVMRLIGVLREKGVYEYYSDRKYNALLEQSQDSPYRRYLGMGLERRSMLIKIRQIVDNFKI